MPVLIGVNLYMDNRGKLLTKTAGALIPVQNKRIEAEERFVARQLRKRSESHALK